MEPFSALLVLCAGNSPVTGEFPHKGQWRGALMFSLICAWINGWVNQSWGWWFETPSRPLWCHCNGMSLSWTHQTNFAVMKWVIINFVIITIFLQWHNDNLLCYEIRLNDYFIISFVMVSLKSCYFYSFSVIQNVTQTNWDWIAPVHWK